MTFAATPRGSSISKAMGKSQKGSSSKNMVEKKASSPKKGRVSPSNTAAFHYFDRRNVKKVCKEDKKRIKEACNDRPEAKKEAADSAAKAKLNPDKVNATTRGLAGTLKKGLAAIDGLGKTKSGYLENDNNKWMDNHCGGLWHKPGGEYGPKDGKTPNTEAFKKEIEEKVEELISVAANVENAAKEKLFNFADDYFKNHAKDVLDGVAENAARRAAISRMPVVNGVISRFTFWETMGTLIGNAAGAIVTGDMERQFDQISQSLTEATEKLQEYKRILAGGLQDAMASTMAALAIANPCIKARKCLLIPYKDSGKTDGSGCCPGQTGHHVLPNAMFERYVPKPLKQDEKVKPGPRAMEKAGRRPCWEKYSEGDALTICLEGTTNHSTNGSHGLAHEGTAAILLPSRFVSDVPYTKVRDKISKMFAETYGCDPECLKAQLDQSLKDKHSDSCGGLDKAQISPHSGKANGGPHVPEVEISNPM